MKTSLIGLHDFGGRRSSMKGTQDRFQLVFAGLYKFSFAFIKGKMQKVCSIKHF